MAKKVKSKDTNKTIEQILWDSANELRGNLDAGEYKSVVLGLVFLKYINEIQELLRIARELKAHSEQASELGLTEEEQAFYDALTRPQAVKDFYENETLVAMARELTEMLRSSRTIDWRQKESARANMRRMVKRLLKKYKYPPEEQKKALETVIRQCELYADSDMVEADVQETRMFDAFRVESSDEEDRFAAES